MQRLGSRTGSGRGCEWRREEVRSAHFRCGSGALEAAEARGGAGAVQVSCSDPIRHPLSSANPSRPARRKHPHPRPRPRPRRRDPDPGAHPQRPRQPALRPDPGGDCPGAANRPAPPTHPPARTLILRAWHVDPLRCPVCQNPMRVIAVIDDPRLVPFLPCVTPSDRDAFRAGVIERMVQATRQPDGRCFEQSRCLHVFFRK